MKIVATIAFDPINLKRKNRKPLFVRDEAWYIISGYAIETNDISADQVTLTEAARQTKQHQLTTCVATYLEVARCRDLPVITLDNAIIQAAKKEAVSVLN